MRKRLRRQLEQRGELHFDITQVAFGRGLSYLSVTEELSPTETGADRKQLVLYREVRTYGRDEQITKKRRIGFRPLYDQRSISYRADATPGRLEITSSFGNACIAFDDPECLRIKGSNIALRFFVKMTPGECAVDRLDGSFQINQLLAGEFLFVPIKGRLDMESEWIWEQGGASDTLLDIVPDENGEFELAIHSSVHGAKRYAAYRPIEACMADSLQAYDAWYALYPAVPGRFERMKQLCAYCVWICHVAPKGIMKESGVSFTKPTASGMFSWHQAYHAMSVVNDADTSTQLMMNFFQYQDEFGELADIYDEHYWNILATKPPFHGYALLYLLDHSKDPLTPAHCEAMYSGLARLYQFWTTLRDTDHDGVPQYNHGCESGIDNSDMFRRGVPVETPDIISYIILLAEGLGKISAIMGRHEEAAQWQAKADALLSKLLTEFWNGKRFVARLSTTHEIVETLELEAYMPVMLGARLPRQILDKMIEDLTDPEQYYTPIGFRSSPKAYKDGVALPGFIGGFAQVKLLPALWEAGEKNLARALIAGYCERSAQRVPGFGLFEFIPEGAPDGGAFFRSPGGELNSLAAAMFICLAGFLQEIGEQE